MKTALNVLNGRPLAAASFYASTITNVKGKLFYYINIEITDSDSFKNFTEEFSLLGLPSLYFLPVGFPVGKVGQGEFSPHVASELI